MWNLARSPSRLALVDLTHLSHETPVLYVSLVLWSPASVSDILNVPILSSPGKQDIAVGLEILMTCTVGFQFSNRVF